MSNLAYITTYEGKYFLCVTDGDFHKWELPISNIARLAIEATEHTAKHVRGLYVPRYVQGDAPIFANEDAVNLGLAANPEE